MEWLFKSMLGIKVKGENNFEISPVIGEGVEHAKGSYNSIYGKIVVNWKKEKSKVLFFQQTQRRHLFIKTNKKS